MTAHVIEKKNPDFSLPPYILKKFLTRFTGNYYNLPFRTHELKRRRREDKLWAYFLKAHIDKDFVKELLGTILRNGNILLYIFAPRNHAKSEMAQSIALMIQELYSHLGVQISIVFTRNYAETNRVLSSLVEAERKAIIIQDEDESLQGEDKIRERDAYINLLDTSRILGISVIICSVIRDDELTEHLTGSLEVIGLDFDSRRDLLYTYDATNYPLGVITMPLHGNEEMRNGYKAQKLKEQLQLVKQRGRRGAADATQIDVYVKKIYDETLNTYPDRSLTRPHFRAVAKRYSYVTGINDAAAIAYSYWKSEQPEKPHVRETQETKFTDEGFEENELEDLPEFQQLWLNNLYFIPPRTTEEGDPSNYPDVIGVLRDGSIGVLNAKYWNWRPGDILYTHKKMKSELLWHDKLKDLGFIEHIKVILFIKHKVTGLTEVIDIPVEKAKTGTYPVRLPNPSSPSSSNLPSPNPITAPKPKKKMAAKNRNKAPATAVAAHSADPCTHSDAEAEAPREEAPREGRLGYENGE